MRDTDNHTVISSDCTYKKKTAIYLPVIVTVSRFICASFPLLYFVLYLLIFSYDHSCISAFDCLIYTEKM